MNTFRALPTFALQQLAGRDNWMVFKNGTAIISSCEETCREYLNKWACGQFKTLPAQR